MTEKFRFQLINVSKLNYELAVKLLVYREISFIRVRGDRKTS